MIGNIILTVLMMFTLRKVLVLVKKQNREVIKLKNQELRDLRTKAFKTLEEQKRFVSLKNPKTPPFRFHWLMIPKTIGTLFIYAIIFQCIMLFWRWAEIIVPAWLAILCVFLLPAGFNFILKKFHLEDGDILDVIK